MSTMLRIARQFDPVFNLQTNFEQIDALLKQWLRPLKFSHFWGQFTPDFPKVTAELSEKFWVQDSKNRILESFTAKYLITGDI